MKTVLGFTLSLFLIVGACTMIGGCIGGFSLPPEKQAKIDSLLDKNLDLGKEIVSIKDDAKLGKFDPLKAIAAIEALELQIKENRAAVGAIYQEAVAAGGTAGGVAGALGRTALHGVAWAAKFIPGPAGPIVQGLLTLLLGGSSTSKKATV